MGINFTGSVLISLKALQVLDHSNTFYNDHASVSNFCKVKMINKIPRHYLAIRILKMLCVQFCTVQVNFCSMKHNMKSELVNFELEPFRSLL